MMKVLAFAAALAVAALAVLLVNSPNPTFAHSPDIGRLLAGEVEDEEEGEIYNRPFGVRAPVASGFRFRRPPSANSIMPGTGPSIHEIRATALKLTARARDDGGSDSQKTPSDGSDGGNAKITPGILNLPWVADGLNEREKVAYNLLDELNEASPEAAARVVAMPFLQSFGAADTEAIYSLTSLATDNPDTLFEILDNPNLSDNGGIEDAEAKIVAVLASADYIDPELVATLLDPSQVMLEERTLKTAYSDQILIAIIRTADGGTSTMDLFEHSVRQSEIIMAQGLRTDYVAALVVDGLPEDVAGAHFYSNIVIPPEIDVDERETRLAEFGPFVIAHEVAHYYWFHDTELWVDEGAADFMAGVIERERVGGPVEPSGIPCPYYAGIFHLELAQPEPDSYGQLCDYLLGERIYLDLFVTMPEAWFYRGFRAFHSLVATESDVAPVDQLIAAFRATSRNADQKALVDAVLSRRYGAVVLTDRSPVKPEIPALNGRVQDAALIRFNSDGEVAEYLTGFFSIPASRISGSYRLALAIEYDAPLAADTELEFSVVEYYEDGFVFDRTVLTETFAAGETETLATLNGIGFIPDFPWPVGIYWVYAYHEGQKIAEIFFDVAP